jgi:hypothetical protein
MDNETNLAIQFRHGEQNDMNESGHILDRTGSCQIQIQPNNTN